MSDLSWPMHAPDHCANRPQGDSTPSPAAARIAVAKRSIALIAALALGGASGFAGPARATSALGTPVIVAYDEAAQPLLDIDDPTFVSLEAESGPAILATWSHPPSLPTPARIAVLRAEAGSDLEEIWSCEDPISGCSELSFRDVTDLEVGRAYDFQVVISDGIGEGATAIQRITLPRLAPTQVSVVRTNANTYEVAWTAAPGAGVYKLTRRDLLTGDRLVRYIDAAVAKYVDAVPAGAYEYAIRACKIRTAEGECGDGSATTRLGIGGDRLIHGLRARVARHRFRPDAELVLDTGPGPPALASERLVYRDEITGAQIAKLTNDPHKDYHLYSNIPVYSADGSQLAYHTDYGWHWGWRVMNADGSGVRDLATDALPIATGAATQLWWNEPHLGVRWSPTDRDVLYYYDAAGNLGALNPPNDAADQLDLGLIWQPSEPFARGFWPVIHPDGSKALGIDAIQQRFPDEFASNSTAHLIDLTTGDLDVSLELTDELGAPLFAHQVWFTKESDYAFSFNGETRAGQWIAATPLASPTVTRLTSQNLWRAAFSPAGDVAAHSAFSGPGAALTELDSGTTTQIVERLGGHKTWDVDPEWFVGNDDDALWRIWIDGHRTRIAAPYTFILYQGEHHTGFMPQVSPDGTKIVFKAPMHGDDDLYAATLKLPDPPDGLALNGSLLTWDAPLHAREVASYNVWESQTSGLDFALLASVPASVLSLDVGDPSARFYRVTAVEHSGIEGLASNEVAGTPALPRRLWFETHLDFVPLGISLPQAMAPVFDGDHTGLYAMEAVTPSTGPEDGARVTVPVPGTAYALWAFTRGGGPDAHLSAYDDGTALGEFAADSADFMWRPLGNTTGDAIATGELSLVPSELGIQIDQLLVTTDLGFVPDGAAMRLDTLQLALPSVANLVASEDTFHCVLTWDEANAPNFSHYDIYANPTTAPASWEQEHLVGSVVETRFVDWGLEPGTPYHYGVVTVDRQGARAIATEATCTTFALDRYLLDLAAEPSSDPHANFAADAATGAWRFDFDIPPALPISEFVAWVQVYSAIGQPLSDALTRTIVDSDGVRPARDWDLASQLFPITRVDGGTPERDTRIWAFLSLADDDHHIYRAAPLPAGLGHVQITPAAERPMPGLRVSRFILTNDLSFVPEGITDYLLPDTRRELALVDPSAQCDDGLDNDGDGAFDFTGDPGCDDANDPDEQSVALACDDGDDNDGDGLADLADPGCADLVDGAETSQLTQCDDGTDNDGDGDIDAADSDCLSPNTTYEEIPECDDGIDNDGDGLVDLANDDGCRALADRSERPDCNDGFDNDGDGATDASNDLGCETPQSPREDPACSDGIDNDDDGLVDYDGGPLGGEADPGCKGQPYRVKEFAIAPLPGCGLGAELALAVPLVMAWRKRQRLRDRARRAGSPR